jgi:hypothetical protein
MSGCGVPPYTAAVGSACWAVLRLNKKNKIRAAAEAATRPPATPPAMAPTFEEEPAELGGEDEVAVSVVWEDEVAVSVGWVDEMEVAVAVEDGITDDVDVETPLIRAPGSTSGRSEKGSILIEHDNGVTEKGVCSYHRQHTIQRDPKWPQSGIYGQYAATTRDK